MKTIKAIVFDFDGTLTKGKNQNVWKALYQKLGYDTGINSAYKKAYIDFINDKLGYEPWVEINEKDFKNAGLTKAIFDETAEKFNLIDGLKDVLKYLKQQGIKIYVLSGNFGYLIRNTLGDLCEFFDEISANEIIFDKNGNLLKLVATKYDYKGKPDFIFKIIKELNISAGEVCFVGNGANDVFVYQSGAKTICINPIDADENNQKKWSYVLKNVTDLKQILDYID